MKIGMTGCLVCALMGVWTGCLAVAADSTGTPYQGIVDRNVFGLKPPPPPPDPESIKPPPPKITLQGITTMRGNKLALMKVLAPPSKPGGKTEEIPLILGVGQKSEDVEVLEINELAGAVKVNDYGTITNLTFKENGVNLATATPGAPGVPPHAGGVPPPGAAPAYNPAAYRPPAGGYSGRPNPRLRQMGGAAYNQGAPQSSYSAQPMPMSTSMPATSTPGAVALNGLGAPASAIQPSKNWPPETPMTPEQSAIMEAAYTMKYQQQIQQGTMPSIPGDNPILNNGNTAPQQNSPSRF